MSRYIGNLQKIKTNIQDIESILDDINIQNITNTEYKTEFLRYKKNFSILKDIIDNIEPDLLNGNIQGFIANAKNSFDEIKRFKNNINSSYIREANNHLDSMSNFIRPYILHKKRLRNSLAKAIEEYISSVEEHLHNINEFKDELNKAKKYTTDIQEYYDKVLNENNETSIKSQINIIFEDIENNKSKINEFYNELLNDDENVSIKTEIIDTKNEINSLKIESKSIKEEIEKLLTDSSNSLKKLKEFYVEVFGEIDEKTEKRIGGLKQEINKRFQEIDSFEDRHKSLLNEYKQKYEAFEEEINSLLIGATNVGLARTYTDNRKKFEKQTKFWNWFFIVIMGHVFCFGLYLVFKDIKIDIEHILKYSPIYVSIIWLAVFATKRRNENMRLEQEYTHKETLAKSYMSYKEQIETLDKDKKDELLEKLLESSTATISQNPSYVLDKNNTENHPAIEIFNSIWKKDKVSLKSRDIKIEKEENGNNSK
jgi:hypothetical protein